METIRSLLFARRGRSFTPRCAHSPVQFFQEPSCELWTNPAFFVLKIDVGMAPALFLRLDKSRPANNVSLLVVFAAQAKIAKISGRNVWSRKIAALSDAKRSVMVLQRSEDIVGEPGRVTKLESDTDPVRNTIQELV